MEKCGSTDLRMEEPEGLKYDRDEGRLPFVCVPCSAGIPGQLQKQSSQLYVTNVLSFQDNMWRHISTHQFPLNCCKQQYSIVEVLGKS